MSAASAGIWKRCRRACEFVSPDDHESFEPPPLDNMLIHQLIHPKIKDIWVWDEKSAQAISTMRGAERRRRYPVSNQLQTVGAVLRGAPAAWREYKKLKAEAFTQNVTMENRVGVGKFFLLWYLLLLPRTAGKIYFSYFPCVKFSPVAARILWSNQFPIR